jgi:hypothetical protein
MLGSLIWSMEAGGFKSLGFVAPYNNLSVHQAHRQIRDFKKIEWCDSLGSQALHECNLVNRIRWVNRGPRSELGLESSQLLLSLNLSEPEDSDEVA